jgi:hypothetical protein
MDFASNPVPDEASMLSKADVCLKRCIRRNHTHRARRLSHLELVNPHVQLITGAIAVVQNNNQNQGLIGLDLIDYKGMAGIVMFGTPPNILQDPCYP